MRIRIQKTPPSGTILLDRKETRNALSRETILDLIEAFGDFHREKNVRAVILSATGDTFCSGVDLKQWNEVAQGESPMTAWEEIANELQELVETMIRFPKPIIAAIDGQVLGAGLALILSADLVIASPRTSFASVAPKFGLVSGLVAPLANWKLAGSFASRLLLGCEPIESEQALRGGLVHYLVNSDQVWAKGFELAKQIAETTPESIQMTKRLLNEMVAENIFTHLVSGSATMATICSTESAIEGLKSFSEKRPPKF